MAGTGMRFKYKMHKTRVLPNGLCNAFKIQNRILDVVEINTKCDVYGIRLKRRKTQNRDR